MRWAVTAFLILLAGSAEASWYPVFSPSFVQLRPGDTTTVIVQAAWNGIAFEHFAPMTFTAEDPTIAVVAGSLPTTQPATVRITALRPGVTRVRLAENGSVNFPTLPVIAVAGRVLAVRITADGALVVGGAITLRATADDPQATFTWYSGRLGDPSTNWQVGQGAEFIARPLSPLVYDYWVLATSPSGAGTATIALDIHEALRRGRSVRH